MLKDNSRLRPLITELQELIKVATEARDSLPLPEDYKEWSERYPVSNDHFWSLRERAGTVGDLYDRLDKSIVETQDSLDDLLATGKRMMRKGGKK